MKLSILGWNQNSNYRILFFLKTNLSQSYVLPISLVQQEDRIKDLHGTKAAF